MNLLTSFFRQKEVPDAPDGQSEALEAHAAEAELATAEAEADQGRRFRSLPSAETVLTEAIASKILHGWLQNRHQTLYPLTLGLRNLGPEKAATLAQMLAVALLSGPDLSQAQQDAALSWFTSVGADEAAHAVFAEAMRDPPATSRVLATVQQQEIAAQAYVAALIAVDQRSPSGRLFLSYLAARLALPYAVVRSAERRYRR